MQLHGRESMQGSGGACLSLAGIGECSLMAAAAWQSSREPEVVACGCSSLPAASWKESESSSPAQVLSVGQGICKVHRALEGWRGSGCP